MKAFCTIFGCCAVERNDKELDAQGREVRASVRRKDSAKPQDSAPGVHPHAFSDSTTCDFLRDRDESDARFEVVPSLLVTTPSGAKFQGPRDLSAEEAEKRRPAGESLIQISLLSARLQASRADSDDGEAEDSPRTTQHQVLCPALLGEIAVASGRPSLLYAETMKKTRHPANHTHCNLHLPAEELPRNTACSAQSNIVLDLHGEDDDDDDDEEEDEKDSKGRSLSSEFVTSWQWTDDRVRAMSPASQLSMLSTVELELLRVDLRSLMAQLDEVRPDSEWEERDAHVCRYFKILREKFLTQQLQDADAGSPPKWRGRLESAFSGE